MAGSICRSAKSYLRKLSQLARSIDERKIEEFAQLLLQAWRRGRRVFVFGNGGSASTASHQVCDLVKTAAVDGQRRLKAYSLVDNVGMNTALGNDIGYERTFVFPLETHAEPGDIAVAISASGNSPNVVEACAWARGHGVTVVALTGFNGGRLRHLADLHINVNSNNYGLIEDAHLAIGHCVAQLLKSHIMAETTAAVAG